MILHIKLLVYNKRSACVGTGMGTTYRSMVLEESLPTPFSPGHTEREKSTLTMMSIGQWATMLVSTFEVLWKLKLHLIWFHWRVTHSTAKLSVTVPLSFAVLFRHWSPTSGSSWVWPCLGPATLPGAWCYNVSFLQRHLPSAAERGWQEGHPVSVWSPSARTTWDDGDQWDWHWNGETIILGMDLKATYTVFQDFPSVVFWSFAY